MKTTFCFSFSDLLILFASVHTYLASHFASLFSLLRILLVAWSVLAQSWRWIRVRRPTALSFRITQYTVRTLKQKYYAPQLGQWVRVWKLENDITWWYRQMKKWAILGSYTLLQECRVLCIILNLGPKGRPEVRKLHKIILVYFYFSV
jgi:hypothetical protein